MIFDFIFKVFITLIVAVPFLGLAGLVCYKISNDFFRTLLLAILVTGMGMIIKKIWKKSEDNDIED